MSNRPNTVPNYTFVIGENNQLSSKLFNKINNLPSFSLTFAQLKLIMGTVGEGKGVSATYRATYLRQVLKSLPPLVAPLLYYFRALRKFAPLAPREIILM